MRSRSFSFPVLGAVPILLLVIACTLSQSRVLADDTPAQLAARKLEDKYRKSTALQATFLERYSENGKLIRGEAGTAYFRRPGKMRWEYERPEKNIFLVDGKNTWFYAPADRTVTRIPARDSADFHTPLALLAGEMKLSRVCSKIQFAPLPPSRPANVLLECILKDSAPSGPKSEELAMRAFFEVSPEGELARLLILSSAGEQTEFLFKNWEFHPSLSDSLFHFDPPPGVVIVNGLLPDAPTTRQKQ